MKRLRSTAVVETAGEETGGRTAGDIHERADYSARCKVQGNTGAHPVRPCISRFDLSKYQLQRELELPRSPVRLGNHTR